MNIDREYIPLVRSIFIEVLYRYKKGAYKGMCLKLLGENSDIWHKAIKPWFKPENFGVTELWRLEGDKWMGIPLNEVEIELRKYYFWFPPTEKYRSHRIKILELVLEKLDEIG